MVDRDVFRRAVDELYAAEPEEFLPRRAALAAAAKTAGDRATAKEITGLRKPTRSAAIVNGLARSHPDRVTSLLDLGSDLRKAERSVDAARLRELTTRRRRLIEDLTRAAFEIADDPSPGAAVKDEVVSTLTAALADGTVADQLRSGTLVKPARWEGFGFGSVPDLTVVPAPPPDDADTVKPAATNDVSGSRPTKRVAVEPDSETAGEQHREKTTEQARREAMARAEEDRREAIAEARRVASEAESAVVAAHEAEQEQQERLRLLEYQVADARRRLDDARLAVRRAEVQQRKAAHALSRVER